VPRYFFNVRNGQSRDDETGAQLGNVKAARLEAIQRFGQLMAEHPEQFDRGHDWRMEVTDGKGLMLFRLDLDLLLVPSPSVPDR
jgi:hypothetical protein